MFNELGADLDFSLFHPVQPVSSLKQGKTPLTTPPPPPQSLSQSLLTPNPFLYKSCCLCTSRSVSIPGPVVSSVESTQCQPSL